MNRIKDIHVKNGEHYYQENIMLRSALNEVEISEW